MSIMIDTLEGTPAEVEQLIAAFRYGASAAREAGLITAETELAIKRWHKSVKVENRAERRRSEHQRQIDGLRDSKWFAFWTNLEPGQEVRWTGTKAATYFVVEGKLHTRLPASEYHLKRSVTGPWIQLRRHSGKTFWAHIAQVRPYDPPSETPDT